MGGQFAGGGGGGGLGGQAGCERRIEVFVKIPKKKCVGGGGSGGSGGSGWGPSAQPRMIPNRSPSSDLGCVTPKLHFSVHIYPDPQPDPPPTRPPPPQKKKNFFFLNFHKNFNSSFTFILTPLQPDPPQCALNIF